MFTTLLGEHFVHTALLAGAVVAIVSGAIGVFVVMRGLSFAVHAISELGFTGATGALVLGLSPVVGMIGGSLAVGAALGVLSLRGRERDSAIGAVLAFGLGLGVLFLSLDLAYQQVIVSLLDERRHSAGTPVVFVTHDVNPILNAVDRVLYLGPDGWAIGAVDDVLNTETLSRLYGIEVDVLRVRGRVVVVGTPDAEHVHHVH